MTDRNARPHFVAFTFDYACSECWPDLPRQREAFRRLVSSWSPYVTRELSELDGAASPTDVMIALEALLFSGLGEQDAVIIYIGGHGARLGNDHFIVGPHANPANLTSRTGLSATDLAHVVGQAKPCQVTLLVDACYSGAGAAHLAATADAAVSRGDGEGKSLFVMSSAQALTQAADGAFIDALLAVLSDPSPVAWGRDDARVAPREVAQTLRVRYGELYESRERGYVGAVMPNLRRRDAAVVDHEVHTRTREHFARAASSPATSGPVWRFVGRRAPLAAINAWLASETSGVFVLTGAPGSGKSAILGHVVLLSAPVSRHELERQPRFAGLAEDTTPALGSITVAIYLRGKTLNAVLTELISGLDIRQAAVDRDEVLTVLSELTQAACVLVDGLDEAAEADAMAIAELLREMADLPRIKVIVGTRADHARSGEKSVASRRGPLLNALEPARVWDLDADRATSRTDVIEYVALSLSDTKQYCGDPAGVRKVAEAVADRVQGVFLYARLMVQILQNEPALDLHAGWEGKLPGTDGDDLLAAAVEEDLRRIPAVVRGRVRRMLAALAWSEGEGLPRHRIWPAVATAVSGEECTDADARDALHHATWYLVESTEDGQPVFRLHHEELVRYFRESTDHGDAAVLQARIARRLTEFAAGGGVGWLAVHPYIRKHLSAHAEYGGVLTGLVCDPGFVAAAEPAGLITRIALLEGSDTKAVAAVARAYLRLGTIRVGTTIGQRLANIALECASEEPDARFELKQFGDVLPWSVGFTAGQATEFREASRADAGDILTLACTNLDLSPVIATGGRDHRVQLWDCDSGVLVRELDGPVTSVRRLAVLRDGASQRLVAGCDDGSVAVWDMSSGEPAPRVDVGAPVGAIAAGSTEAGPTVVAGCDDGSLHILLDAKAEPIRTLKAHDDGVTSTAIGRVHGLDVVASGGLDRAAKLWAMPCGELMLVLTGPTGSILSVVIGAVGGTPVVAAASSDESIWVWDAQSGAVLHELKLHSAAVLCASFAVIDGVPMLASGSADLTARIWDCRSGACIHTLEGHTGAVRALTFSRFGSQPVLISGAADRTLRAWSVRTGQAVRPAVAGSPIPRAVWASGAAVRRRVGPRGAHHRAIRTVAAGVASGRSVVASGSTDEYVHVTRADTGETIEQWRAHTGGVHCITFTETKGRSVIISGGADQLVRVWDARDGTLLQEFAGHRREVWGVASGVIDGHEVAISGSRDQSVRIWRLSDGENIACLEGSTERIWGVAFSGRCGRPLVAAGSTDRTIWIWDARSWQCVARLRGHTRGARYVTFAEIGGRSAVIASGADATVRVWDLETRREIATLRGHSDGVWGVAAGEYSGRSIVASAGEDLTVRLWDLLSGRSLSVPQSAPAYAVDFAQSCVLIGTDSHVSRLQLQSGLFGEMST